MFSSVFPASKSILTTATPRIATALPIRPQFFLRLVRVQPTKQSSATPIDPSTSHSIPQRSSLSNFFLSTSYNQPSRTFTSVNRLVVKDNAFKSTLLASMPLLNLTSTLYFSSRRSAKWNDDDGPEVKTFKEREMTPQEREEIRRKIKFNKEEKKQFYRANDGMWASSKKQAHRAEIVQDHYRAEETYKVNEYNDYVKELKATRRMNVLEKKDKKLMGYNSEDEEDDNPFPSNATQTRIDNELKDAVEDHEKQAIYLKYEQKQEDETTKRMLWLAMLIIAGLLIPWDSRNPDLPF